MRIGIIGAGRMGAWHARNLASFDDGHTLLVHDARYEAAESLAKAVDGTAHHRADELLEAVDAVVVAVPAAMRTAAFPRAVEAGLPVFCEKPLAHTAEAARALAAVAAAAGNHRVQVGFQRRCDPGHRAVRERLGRGDLGRLLMIRCTAFDHEPPPAGYDTSSGGIFADCLIHDIDAVHWLTGQRTVSVLADEARVGGEPSAGGGPCGGGVAVATALLTLADGTRAVLTASRFNPYGYDHRAELLGTRDSLTIGLDERTPLRSPFTSGTGTPVHPAYTGFTDRFARAYQEEMRAFVRLARGEEPSVCPPAEAVLAQEVADAAARSAATGALVTLPAPRGDA
ncbi:Gfo/Idh/MocA family oxidoreductase [Streptomyces sp. AC1-42W]|uniref:Gfo/Idh/MocA family oxidoreductase n=1 Tax=Streptomyces sp. AC1-42W TaxID=2218666 RepID=UPI000DADD3BF|nr:Gfo/Idh/MocA family oxidoreductase [Streptomyces sp. AC1-42W]PZT75475.1 streptomycin biosynthesis protein StrI [Streptomyces sp. AC1-42W]